MVQLLVLSLLAAHPDLETKVLLPGTDGEPRLVWLRAKTGTQVQIDQSQAVLLINLLGEVVLPGGEKPRAIHGEARRCESGLHLDFGAELLLLQASAGPEEAVGTSLKQKCPRDARKLARSESGLNERFDIGTIGTVQFLSQSPLAYAAELTFSAGATVAAHRHDTSSEVLYVLDGGGTLTIGENQSVLAKGSAISIPKATQHAFTAGPKGFRAIQFYLPPGPEERFRPKPPAPPPPTVASCKTDGDCTWTTRTLSGPRACCATCAATPGNVGWVKKVEETCASVPGEGRWPCTPLPCGPVMRVPHCVDAKCTIDSR